MNKKLQTELLEDQKRKLKKALTHLNYSYNKIRKLPAEAPSLDEESLETWESFAARFARVANIFITKYLRTRISIEDPGFEGSVRDILDRAEKLNLLDKADTWFEIRGLRNITAHEYTEEQLSQFFQQLRKYAPILLKIGEQL